MPYAPDHLRIETEAGDGAAVLTLVGEVDMYSAPQVDAALNELVERGDVQVTIELGQVRFLDSTGLRVLVGGTRRLRDAGGSLTLANPTAMISRVLEITRLDEALHVVGGPAAD